MTRLLPVLLATLLACGSDSEGPSSTAPVCAIPGSYQVTSKRKSGTCQATVGVGTTTWQFSTDTMGKVTATAPSLPGVVTAVGSGCDYQLAYDLFFQGGATSTVLSSYSFTANGFTATTSITAKDATGTQSCTAVTDDTGVRQ